MRSLRGSPLLFGFRNSDPVDVDALADLISRIGLLAEEVDEIAELDCNPVVVSPDGALVVDAKLRLVTRPHASQPLRPRLNGAIMNASDSETLDVRFESIGQHLDELAARASRAVAELRAQSNSILDDVASWKQQLDLSRVDAELARMDARDELRRGARRVGGARGAHRPTTGTGA